MRCWRSRPLVHGQSGVRSRCYAYQAPSQAYSEICVHPGKQRRLVPKQRRLTTILYHFSTGFHDLRGTWRLRSWGGNRGPDRLDCDGVTLTACDPTQLFPLRRFRSARSPKRADTAGPGPFLQRLLNDPFELWSYAVSGLTGAVGTLCRIASTMSPELWP